MGDKLELRGTGQGKLLAERVAGTDANGLPPSGGYCVTVKADDEALSAYFPYHASPCIDLRDDLSVLVEFIGYPQEAPPERERLEAAERDRDVARRDLTLLNRKHLDALDDRTEIVAQVEALLRSLKDAWWLEAASAYRQLAHRLGIHG